MQTITGILDWPAPPQGAPRHEGARLRRVADASILQHPDDPLIPASMGERFGLRPGLEVTVEVSDGGDQGQQRRDDFRGNQRPHERGGHRGNQRGNWRNGPAPARGPVARRIVAIEGVDAADYRPARPFEDLTSIDPQPRLTLEHPGCPVSCRLIDLFCPIGRGQRGLIVSPPKAGKTTLLKDIALGLLRNHSDIEIVVLLIDERPEEVTDFRRTFTRPPADVAGPLDATRVRVIASSNDHTVDRHITVATVTIDRCKRLAEKGKHVVVLVDSLTRMGRAFNQSRRHASAGRTLSGGLDAKALEVPRQIFGAARNTEEAGSLTIIASCLVDTGSQADTVIFEEFKGSGNMELILDRKVSERRLFPAINLAASGTRKEHLLLTEKELQTMSALRRRLLAMPPHVQVEQLLAAMKRYPTNDALVGA